MNAPPTIVYIFDRYPVRTATFLQREIAGVKSYGLPVNVHSLGHRKTSLSRDDSLDVACFRWWDAWRLIIALPRELRRDPTLLRDGWRMLKRHRPTRLANFRENLWAVVFAVCRAEEFRKRGVRHVHGTWATSPATAGAILGRLCGIPFSLGAHSHDIYKDGGDRFLEPKLRAASFVHTTTQTNAAYLRQLVPQSRIVFARRGLEGLPAITNHSRPPGPIRILSVARLAPKKGHRHQLAAAARLREWRVPFELRIIGYGVLQRELQCQINALSLADAVTLCSGQPHDQVQKAYAWADIFWHTGVVDKEGNRDGLPNVIPEAFAHRLPVICSREPGAMEAVTHEVSGLVVDVTNAEELARAVQRLSEDEPLRRRLGENGRRWVEENFLVSNNAAILAEAFRRAVGA